MEALPSLQSHSIVSSVALAVRRTLVVGDLGIRAHRSRIYLVLYTLLGYEAREEEKVQEGSRLTVLPRERESQAQTMCAAFLASA